MKKSALKELDDSFVRIFPELSGTKRVKYFFKMFETILLERKKFSVKESMSFLIVKSKGRAYKHPTTGKSINVDDHYKVIVKLSKRLKKILAQKYENEKYSTFEKKSREKD